MASSNPFIIAKSQVFKTFEIDEILNVKGHHENSVKRKIFQLIVLHNVRKIKAGHPKTYIGVTLLIFFPGGTLYPLTHHAIKHLPLIPQNPP